MSTQTDLGFERVDTVRFDIAISQIEPTSDRADHFLIESIRLLGIQHPIVLRDKAGADPFKPDQVRFVVVDGRRRVAAARMLGMETVPAALVRGDGRGAEVQALTAALNINRSSNALDEAETIGRLRDEHGFTEQALGRIWPRAIIAKRLRLYEAPQEIKGGVREGTVAEGTAEMVANLPGHLQARAVALFTEQGRLTRRDITELRQAQKRSEIEALPDDLFGPVPEMEAASDEAFSAALETLGAVHRESDAERIMLVLAGHLRTLVDLMDDTENDEWLDQAFQEANKIRPLLARIEREYSNH